MSQFHFKQFSITQRHSAMKVTLDACLFAAYVAQQAYPKQGILDLGMGTGLLSLMLAQAFDTPVVGVELDDDAYQEALSNISSSPFKQRVNAVHGDIRQWQSDQKFDLVVSNPPFFTDHLLNSNQQRAMARHNTSLPFTSLLACIERSLSLDGYAWILLPVTEANLLQDLLSHTSLLTDRITHVRSKPNKQPHRVFIRLRCRTHESNAASQPVTYDELCIHNGNEYDVRFKELLEPYYLKL